MLDDLKFVQGAVAKKDFVPSLTHFVIENGLVRGFNGVLALCSSLPLDITCKPKAEPLIRAIGNCTDSVQLSLTPGGKLSIRSGKFKALVECVDGDTPHCMPEGDRIEVNGEALLRGLKAMAPFIGNDASRPWSNGVLLKGFSAFATNNVTLVEYWLGTEFPRVVNLPRAAVKEMLRIGEAPTHAQLAENSITFHYPNNRWLRTQLYATDWPNLEAVLSQASKQEPMPEGFFDGLATIKPFVDKIGSVYFLGGSICTHANDADGTTFDVPGLQDSGLFQIDMLQKLDGVATSIDWTAYPKPCMFVGENLRGAIVGMRK
jgi:DNA polymerase III sliding clamp (beta) subunit (PCNA family)